MPKRRNGGILKGDLIVLIDTSVWVELLRHSIHPLRAAVDQLLSDDLARLCGPIAAELMQGATTAKDLAAVEALASAIPSLSISENHWLRAGRLGQKLRAKGVTVGLLDCYLAEAALAHDAAIFSLDHHFSLMAKHMSLRLFSPTELK